MAGSIVGIPNVDALKNKAREKLAYLLSTIPGDKDLILDPDLILPLDRLAGATFLKKCGIDKIYKLDPQVTVGVKQKVYILRPTIDKTKIICDHINSDKSQNRWLARIDVIFLPRKLYICEELFEYEGVFGDVNLNSLDLGFIPLDRDILSLELPNYFSDFFVNKNYTWIQTVANSLVELQKQFGYITNVYGQGHGAKLVFDMMKRLLPSAEIKDKQRDREIGHLFLIDRDVDYASTLLTQLTYEGQLDEIFSIKCGFIALGSEVTGKSDPVKLSLTSEDKVFDEIRDAHITKAFDVLYKKVKELVAGAEKRQHMNVSDIHEYIKSDLSRQQHHHGSVALHIRACESINKILMNDRTGEQMRVEQDCVEGVSYQECISFIEDAITLKFPIEQTLRLMCLFASSHGGLQPKDFNSLKTKFLQSYGHQHLITFSNLSKLGLFYEQELKLNTTALPSSKLVGKLAASAISYLAKSNFHNLIRKMNLVPKVEGEFDYKNPTNPAYVFGGAYIPLICNLVQMVLERGGFDGMDEITKLLPGEHFANNSAKSARGSGKSVCDQVVLVCVLGGITYSEIAAFRLLGRVRGYRFIITSTSIVNGQLLMKSFIPS